MTAQNPLYAANQLNNMAAKATDNKLAFALNGLSIALISVMLIREFRDLMHDKKESRCFDRQEAARHQR